MRFGGQTPLIAQVAYSRRPPPFIENPKNKTSHDAFPGPGARICYIGKHKLFLFYMQGRSYWELFFPLEELVTQGVTLSNLD